MQLPSATPISGRASAPKAHIPKRMEQRLLVHFRQRDAHINPPVSSAPDLPVNDWLCTISIAN
ncbi:hypothetical protein [Sporisorium scitamineum]|uniref:Uncharacterized protein n=1 Tax=Sporisorium scitamineum TaxID=49012 RepID=A0A0F7SAE1_9BASI|nr:hypothetical protein [Sporisorium scitamineum]